MAAEKTGAIVKLVKLALGWFWLYFLSPSVLSISSAQCLEFLVKEFGCPRLRALCGLMHLEWKPFGVVCKQLSGSCHCIPRFPPHPGTLFSHENPQWPEALPACWLLGQWRSFICGTCVLRVKEPERNLAPVLGLYTGHLSSAWFHLGSYLDEHHVNLLVLWQLGIKQLVSVVLSECRYPVGLVLPGQAWGLLTKWLISPQKQSLIPSLAYYHAWNLTIKTPKNWQHTDLKSEHLPCSASITSHLGCFNGFLNILAATQSSPSILYQWFSKCVFNITW